MANPNSSEKEQRIGKVTINLVDKSDGSNLAESEFLQRFNSTLDKRTFEILIENYSKMQQWIARDKENLRFFLEDPIASLQKAEIQLEEEVLENIRTIRQKNVAKISQLANWGSMDEWKTDEIKFEASTTTATNTLRSTLELRTRQG